MKLTAIDLYRYTLPLAAPLTLKGAPLHERTGVLIRVVDEAGHYGWGEAAPLPGFSRERLEMVESQLRDVQREWTAQMADDPIDPARAVAQMLDQKEWAASVRFGVELAVGDVIARGTGGSLPRVWCSDASSIVSLNGLLLGGKEDIIDRAGKLRAAGYRAVKLKVGRQPVAEDVVLVREVSAVLGASVALRLDANRRWTMDEAIAFSKGIADIPVAYIEEPLYDASQLSALASRTQWPIALDESLVGMPVAQLKEHTYAAAVVLKPTVLGGIAHTLAMAQMAQSLGMASVLSAAFETGVGLRGLTALAACMGDTPVGLDTYHWLADDVFEPRLLWSGPQIDVGALLKTPRHISERYLEILTPVL